MYGLDQAPFGGWSRVRFYDAIDADVDIIRELTSQRVKAATREIAESHTAREARERLFEACRKLGQPRPKAGRPVDLRAARKAMHRLARAYHPDLSRGNEQQYREVMDAFRTLEAFVQRMSKPDDGESDGVDERTEQDVEEATS